MWLAVPAEVLSVPFRYGLAPLAFIVHGVAVGLLVFLVKIRTQESGAMLPKAFQGVLFLDAFGWAPNETAAKAAGSDRPSASRTPEARPSSAPPSALVQGAARLPVPQRPDDLRPPGAVDDMRLVPGAPDAWDEVNSINPAGRDFWDSVTFMPSEGRKPRFEDDDKGNRLAQRIRRPPTQCFCCIFELPFALQPGPNSERGVGVLLCCWPGKAPGVMDEDAAIETGHESEAPGHLPWVTFRNAAGVTSLAWILAGAASGLPRAREPSGCSAPFASSLRISAMQHLSVSLQAEIQARLPTRPSQSDCRHADSWLRNLPGIICFLHPSGYDVAREEMAQPHGLPADIGASDRVHMQLWQDTQKKQPLHLRMQATSGAATNINKMRLY